MQIHDFRGDHAEHAKEIAAFRDLLRGKKHVTMPQGPEGLVIEDLDLVLRWYGDRFKLDDIGRFRLIELKNGNAPLGPSKKYTFGLIDNILAYAPAKHRYDGYYVVRASDKNHDEATTYEVSGVQLTSADFISWVLWPWSEIKPYWNADKHVVPDDKWMLFPDRDMPSWTQGL